MLISHRLANVTVADNIYVMNSGSIIESGTHEGLLKRQGVYADLWIAQQALTLYIYPITDRHLV